MRWQQTVREYTISSSNQSIIVTAIDRCMRPVSNSCAADFTVELHDAKELLEGLCCFGLEQGPDRLGRQGILTA